MRGGWAPGNRKEGLAGLRFAQDDKNVWCIVATQNVEHPLH
jgi:hypothetical protein